jgi:Na+/H+-dicarboxylate symporter
MKLSSNIQILIGAAFGILSGIILNRAGLQQPIASHILYIFGLLGGIFVSLLKMILIPLVFVSITVGIANLRAHAQMGKVWKFTLFYYFSTTALAVFAGMVVVNIFKPGLGLEIDMFSEMAAASSVGTLTLPQFFENFVSQLFINPVAAMANGQIIATIVFAIFMGITLVVLGDRAKHTITLMKEFFEVIMLMVNWIMILLPVGIMALLGKLVATQDPVLFISLGKYVAVVVGVTLFHGFIVLPAILFFLTRINLRIFYTGIRSALITAFSTSSSSATLPVTYRCMTNNLRVDKDVAGFVLPLGATINMDGTAMYEAIAAIFVANLAGIELNVVQQLTIFFMAIVASVGAPGIPSAGMVTLLMVLESVGLPIEAALALLLPIDRPLDAVRTMVNVNGDCIGSKIIDHYTASSLRSNT